MAIFKVSCNNLPGLFRKKSHLSCYSVSNGKDSGEPSPEIVVVFKEMIYIVIAEVVTAPVVAVASTCAIRLNDVNVWPVVGWWVSLRWFYWAHLSVCKGC